MSLLDRWNEEIVLYPEETWTDSDGNLMTRASQTGIPCKVMLQYEPASGTSERRIEQDNEGFETEQNYRMRVPRGFPYTIGAQARISWKGQWWSVNGDAQYYNGSPRTKHTDYAIRRS